MIAAVDPIGSAEPVAAPAAVSFAEAFRFWLKLGFRVQQHQGAALTELRKRRRFQGV
jgi:hypothetical protein